MNYEARTSKKCVYLMHVGRETIRPSDEDINAVIFLLAAIFLPIYFGYKLFKWLTQ